MIRIQRSTGLRGLPLPMEGFAIALETNRSR